jgi:NAD(P)-dependent dehydrogenase (short-subunit alcohol dehydrogenase family)
VYCSGRTTRRHQSSLARPETIEETAELVTAAGGHGIAKQVDHMNIDQVRGLVETIAADQDGRIDILVNDVWGGQPLAEWGPPFWEHDLPNNLLMHRNGVETHLITSWHVAPLMVQRRSGLIIEITDGADPSPHHFHGHLFYDLTKKSVMRLAIGQAAEMGPHGVTAVSLTPGWLRSEELLEERGVTESTWQDVESTTGPGGRPNAWLFSESPHYIGRAVVALAADPSVKRWNGQSLSAAQLAQEYGFTDTDGRRPLPGGLVEVVNEAGDIIRREDYRRTQDAR